MSRDKVREKVIAAILQNQSFEISPSMSFYGLRNVDPQILEQAARLIEDHYTAMTWMAEFQCFEHCFIELAKRSEHQKLKYEVWCKTFDFEIATQITEIHAQMNCLHVLFSNGNISKVLSWEDQIVMFLSRVANDDYALSKLVNVHGTDRLHKFIQRAMTSHNVTNLAKRFVSLQNDGWKIIDSPEVALHWISSIGTHRKELSKIVLKRGTQSQLIDIALLSDSRKQYRRKMKDEFFVRQWVAIWPEDTEYFTKTMDLSSG